MKELSEHVVGTAYPEGLRVIPNALRGVHSASEKNLRAILSVGGWKPNEAFRFTERVLFDLEDESISPLCDSVVKQSVYRGRPNQLQVVNYSNTGYIPLHIDIISTRITNCIAGLTFGSDQVLRMKRGSDIVKVLLPNRSLYVLEGDALEQWHHGKYCTWENSEEACSSSKYLKTEIFGRRKFTDHAHTSFVFRTVF